MKLKKFCSYKIFHNFHSYKFSNIYHNLPAVHGYYLPNGKYVVLDSNSYSPIIEEFLNKKWVMKSEIPPKIKALPNSTKEFMNTQKQFNNKKLIALDEVILRYMYEGGYIDRNYLLNILFKKNEIELFKEILDKICLNGYVIKKFDNPEHEENNQTVSEIKRLVNVFFLGQELSDNDKVVETAYEIEKYMNNQRFKKSKNMAFYSIYSNYDLMTSKGIVRLPREVDFKRGNFDLKRILAPIDINKFLDLRLSIRKASFGSSLIKRILYRISTNEYSYKNNHKIKLLAELILNRLSIYLQSAEFTKEFDTELDFYVFNAIFSLHLWIICQRLQNFKRSKAAYDLTDEIIKQHKTYSNKEFQQVDTLRKISKFKNIQEIYEDQKNTLHHHFNINSPTKENNYLKIDALVWSYIFREKIPRYDDRVYKMSHYIIHHVEKFKTISYEDYEKLNINFDLNCIPFNLKDQITRYNKPLNKEDFFKEQYSDFLIKKYYYEYKTEEGKEIINLKKTFIRQTHMSSFDKENYNIRSMREEDQTYDELKDNERKEKWADIIEFNLNNMKDKNSILFKLFSKHLEKGTKEIIDICEREDLRRERDEYNERNLKLVGRSEKVRFSEKLDVNVKETLYKYRDILNNNQRARDEGFLQSEMKILHPDANVVTSRRKRKPLVDKLFKLNPY